MDKTINLAQIVRQEVEDYARGTTWQAVSYPVSDIERQTYAVLVVPDSPRTHVQQLLLWLAC